MPSVKSNRGFLSNKYERVLTMVLLLQATLFYSASRGENVSPIAPLKEIPKQLQSWRMVQESEMQKDELEILKSDDTLNRLYQDANSGGLAGVFIAYFKTTRTGQAPHSPKNCLPGSGWTQDRTGYMDVAIPGEAQPVTINRHVVAKGSDKSLVLYWYQSRRRVVASEYAARFWLAADSIRYHRSDTSIVRIVVPVEHNDEEAAQRSGVQFIQALMPSLRRYLPA